MPKADRFAAPIDWGNVAPLRLRARTIADGVYAGAHRSLRRGPGVEFGGYRAYVPGDDLRWLDRRALLRHDRLLVREFETETDRGLWLVVDATLSMGYRSPEGPCAKIAYAALLAAALSRVALASGDPVGLEWIGGTGAPSLPASSGREAFDRIVGALQAVTPHGDIRGDTAAFDRALAPIARRARRGAIIVLLSDLIDLPDEALFRFAALASGGRTLTAVSVLDPAEARFPFEGTVRLRALEGTAVVETDAGQTRARYLDALYALTSRWSRTLASRGGHLVAGTTDRDAAQVVRDIVGAVSGRAPRTEQRA